MSALRWLLLLVVIGAGALLGGGRAEAACAALSLCSCTTSASGVSFGSYDPTSSTAQDATGTVTVECTLLVALAGTYAISLNPGLNGTYAARKLKLSSTVNYNLYTTTGRTTVWGDGTGGTSTVIGTLPLLLFSSQTFTIYGRIPASQNVAPGVYTDTIVVTVAY